MKNISMSNVKKVKDKATSKIKRVGNFIKKSYSALDKLKNFV